MEVLRGKELTDDTICRISSGRFGTPVAGPERAVGWQVWDHILFLNTVFEYCARTRREGVPSHLSAIGRILVGVFNVDSTRGSENKDLRWLMDILDMEWLIIDAKPLGGSFVCCG